MRVLLIEDDYVLGEAVRDHVASLGHGVDWMKRLDDAREALATVAYELVLLDLNLPDGRGLDLLRELRRQGGDAPVIILTAQDQIAARIEGLNSGADDYLVKPFDLSELVGARRRRRAPLWRQSQSAAAAWRTRDRSGAPLSSASPARPVDLTAREWAVLERLVRHPNALIAKIRHRGFALRIRRRNREQRRRGLRQPTAQEARARCHPTVRGAGYMISA